MGADGSQIDTWEENLLAESHIRYGGYGGIAYRHIADNYIALFSHFIPCGVWEAVYIIEGLLQNQSDIQPDIIHADTQGQSLPVFGLAALMGFDLLGARSTLHLQAMMPSTTCESTADDTRIIVRLPLVIRIQPKLGRATPHGYQTRREGRDRV